MRGCPRALPSPTRIDGMIFCRIPDIKASIYMLTLTTLSSQRYADMFVWVVALRVSSSDSKDPDGANCPNIQDRRRSAHLQGPFKGAKIKSRSVGKRQARAPSYRKA